MRIARKDYWRMSLVGALVFSAIFMFTLLMHRSTLVEVDAADLSKFDAGYIISDYQMGNYISMTEVEIQAWLTSMNSCPNTDYTQYQRMSAASPSLSWHWANGHFVCLSEELFGDGEVIGSGDTAAHIIWQAAQDYHINPQVLLVLLQKESSLITDTIPNNLDYRKATGYGCPDTAPCSAEYYGFKNQIRKAAELFHTVLTGGWTNYPLGENYVRYNKYSECGGSIVNIRSLATSALYRYTPYQPFGGYLEDGTNCNATGNINFYTLFEDWWGGIRTEFDGTWREMMSPRVMQVTTETMMVNPIANQIYAGEFAGLNKRYYFTTKIDIKWNGKIETCLRTAADTENEIDRCIIMSRMSETNKPLYVIEDIEPTVFDVLNDTYKYNLKTEKVVQNISVNQYSSISFSAKIIYDDKIYYQTTYDKERGNEYFIPAESLRVILFEDFLYPRNMEVQKTADFIDLKTGEICKNVKAGFVTNFVTKTKVEDKYYYRSADETNNSGYCVVAAELVGETSIWTGLDENEIKFVDFMYPREMIFKKDTYSINVVDGTSCEKLYSINEVANFTTKIKIGVNYYYRTEEETSTEAACVLKSSGLREL